MPKDETNWVETKRERAPSESADQPPHESDRPPMSATTAEMMSTAPIASARPLRYLRAEGGDKEEGPTFPIGFWGLDAARPPAGGERGGEELQSVVPPRRLFRAACFVGDRKPEVSGRVGGRSGAEGPPGFLRSFVALRGGPVPAKGSPDTLLTVNYGTHEP